MVVGLFVNARLGSSRLPRKHLQSVGGKMAITCLMDRIYSALRSEIEAGRALPIITTGLEDENHDLAPYAAASGFNIFYGDPKNIPNRHLQAAAAFGLDAILPVDGDDLLCSPAAMRYVFEQLCHSAAVAKTSGLPLGMNAWGYSAACLAKALENCSLEVLETGWGRIFEEFPVAEKIMHVRDQEQVRMTLDYPQDLAFFRRVFDLCPPEVMADDAALIEWILANGANRENIDLLDTYWANFQVGVDNENLLGKDHEL